MSKLIKEWKTRNTNWDIKVFEEDDTDAIREYWRDANTEEEQEDLLNTCIFHEAWDTIRDLIGDIYFDYDLGEDLEFDGEKGARYGDTYIRFNNTEYNFHVYQCCDLDIDLESVDFIVKESAKKPSKKEIWKKLHKQISSSFTSLSKYKDVLPKNDVYFKELDNFIKNMDSMKETDIPDCVYDFPEGQPDVKEKCLPASKYSYDGKLLK